MPHLGHASHHPAAAQRLHGRRAGPGRTLAQRHRLLAAARFNDHSRFALFENGKPLIAAGPPPRAALLPPPPRDLPHVFLGLLDGVAIFAADLTDTDQPPLPEASFIELRGVAGTLSADDAALLATGRGLLQWRARHRFCANCGGPNLPRRGGHVLHCASCGTEHFPRTDPAVIMLVTRGNKLLLGQGKNFPVGTNWFSTLAGFLEPGENLEDAVRREVFEETGIRVGDVSYHSSQPWPFPASLMVGFHAEGLNDEIILETAEMRDARWFSREDIADRAALGFDLPGPESIARRLIEDWLAQDNAI